MTTLPLLLVAGGVALGLYVVLVAALLRAGRREDARALAGFIPDCVVLVRRLLQDPDVPRRHKVLLVGYLALPVDLVPDFIPVAGQLDDALVAALVLRAVLRGAGPDRLAGHWPGPGRSLEVLRRLVGTDAAASAPPARPAAEPAVSRRRRRRPCRWPHRP